MNQDSLPRTLAKAAERIQSEISGIEEGTDEQQAEVHLATALSAIREISALPPAVASPALASVADVLAAFRARFSSEA